MPQTVFAVAYLRVSTEDQLQGDGFRRQEEKIQEFAARKGWKVLETFRDAQTGEDVSFDRPGFRSMDEFMTVNNVKNIIVERSDRWARDLVVSEVMLADMMEKGRRVFCADGGVELTDDPDNPTSELVRRILAVIDQYAKKVQMVRMKAGLNRKRRDAIVSCGQGRYAWRCPREAIIRDAIIFMHAEKKWSPYQIAKLMQANRDVFVPRGENWSSRIVRIILKREIGNLVEGATMKPTPGDFEIIREDVRQRSALVTPIAFAKLWKRVTPPDETRRRRRRRRLKA